MRWAEGSSELGSLELTLEGDRKRIRKAGSIGDRCVEQFLIMEHSRSIELEQWGIKLARRTHVCPGRHSSGAWREGQPKGLSGRL